MVTDTILHPAGRRRPRSGGFTFVDLMTSLLIVCLLAGWLFGAGELARAHETANRVKCANQLRTIGQAILLYANANRGAYPRTVFKMDEATTQYTGVECGNPFGKGDDVPRPNDVTAALFLLLRTQQLTADVFVCPSTAGIPVTPAQGKTLRGLANFASEEQLGYSIASPYPDRKAVDAGYRWNVTIGAEFALAADMNPGQVGDHDVTPGKGPRDPDAPAALMRKANSMNHRGDGQNVLYGDTHVEFATHPFVGTRRDNIYTVSGGQDGAVTTSATIAGPPAWAGDNVLLPVATRAVPMRTPEEEDALAREELRKELPRLKEQLAKEEADYEARSARLRADWERRIQPMRREHERKVEQLRRMITEAERLSGAGGGVDANKPEGGR